MIAVAAPLHPAREDERGPLFQLVSRAEYRELLETWVGSWKRHPRCRAKVRKILPTIPPRTYLGLEPAPRAQLCLLCRTALDGFLDVDVRAEPRAE